MASDSPTVTYGISCEKPSAGPCGVVLFGASGDLSRRKVLPALFRLFRDRSVPDRFFVLGFGRTPLSDTAFRDLVASLLPDNDLKPDFLRRCHYLTGSYTDPASFRNLAARLEELHRSFATEGNTVFHLAVPPDLFGPIGRLLGHAGLGSRSSQGPYRRVMVEKPFGKDLASCRRLNAILLRSFRDSDIYRIDHYLGKHTVQNLLVFRFANRLFEPVWNRRYIDRILIDFAETDGVSGRAGFFDTTGLVRDVLQNHLLQLLALVTMDPPASFQPEPIRDSQARFFKSLRLRSLLRGQYTAGTSHDGHPLPAYTQEQGIPPDSTTETWFRAVLTSHSRRWRGVPFILTGGKRLHRKETSITVVFNKPPYCMLCKSSEHPAPNTIRFLIQPQQKVILTFQAKIPGSRMCFTPMDMEFDYERLLGHPTTGDYEHLILDCMNGDQTLFWRKDGVEATWRLLDGDIRSFDHLSLDRRRTLLHTYPAGSEGPRLPPELWP